MKEKYIYTGETWEEFERKKFIKAGLNPDDIMKSAETASDPTSNNPNATPEGNHSVSNKTSKKPTNLPLIFAIIIIIILLMQLTYTHYKSYTIDDIEAAYDDGYNEGVDTGYKRGYDTGYRQGVDIGSMESRYSSSSAYDDSYSYDYDVPSSAVYVTASGSKYHKSWCQYVRNKAQLYYYDSATEAEWDGYSACSVCF